MTRVRDLKCIRLKMHGKYPYEIVKRARGRPRKTATTKDAVNASATTAALDVFFASPPFPDFDEFDAFLLSVPKSVAPQDAVPQTVVPENFSDWLKDHL